MDEQRVFFTSNMQAVVACPHCGMVAKKSVAHFRAGVHAVNFRCDCGREFPTKLDCRDRFRRDLFGISGTFAIDPPGIDWASMTVKNISPYGVAFRASFCRILKTGDLVRVRFNMDDAARTAVDARGQISYVVEDLAGCRFAAGVRPLLPSD